MTETAKTLKFDNPGLGIGVAGGWFLVNGRKYWISFMTNSEGKGKRRLWNVIATHFTGEGAPIKVAVSKFDSYRWEAVELALEALSHRLPADGTVNIK